MSNYQRPVAPGGPIGTIATTRLGKKRINNCEKLFSRKMGVEVVKVSHIHPE